jgi:hypothetical protein
MKKLILLTLVAMLALAAFPSIAQAQTLEECQSLIAQTSSDLAGVTIGGNNPDQTRASLQSKLVGASTKLTEGKNEDAIAKLVDFQTSVQKLSDAPKPKISQADAQLLTDDANNAIACIQGLG